jgi:hypothetical protein
MRNRTRVYKMSHIAVFTLARFVHENACNIAIRYLFPYLPWQLGSFLSLVALPKVAKSSTGACRCCQRFPYRFRQCK